MNNILDFYKQNNKLIKLNLGCRNKPLPTYINIDIDPSNPYADVIDNAFELKNFKDESCDLIEAVHMFEHLDYIQSLTALSVWRKKLKSNGILRLSVPDASKSAALLLLTNDKQLVRAMFSGSQNNEWDYHKDIHTKESLTKQLLCNGFKDVREWLWNETWPHNYCDSYASAYWPPMHKQFILDNGKEIDLGGICLSLNLEATK